MSWSRGYGPGLLAALILQAREDAPAVKATIPEFEHEQVDAAINAAEAIGPTIPAESSVRLSLSGHGWRTTDGSGSGNVCANVAYSIPATAPLPSTDPAPVDGADGAGAGTGE